MNVSKNNTSSNNEENNFTSRCRSEQSDNSHWNAKQSNSCVKTSPEAVPPVPPTGIHLIDRIISSIDVPIGGIEIAQAAPDRILLCPPAQGWVVVARAELVQAGTTLVVAPGILPGVEYHQRRFNPPHTRNSSANTQKTIPVKLTMSLVTKS